MITVFKTSIETKKEVELATNLLNKLLPPDAKWNFDLEDCDKILRIDCETTITELILTNNLFDCKELH